jgi:hypothetical protein
MVHHLPAHGIQLVLDNAGHMGIGIIMQHDITPQKHAGIFSPHSSTKVLESSTLALCTDGDVKVLEGKH